MQSDNNRLSADLARLVNGIAGTLAGAGREAERALREKAGEWAGERDSIGRDEFEAVKAMAAAARDENQALKARIEALEAKARKAAPPVASSATGKPARKGARPGARS